MITVTLQEAKAKLNALVKAACSGEDVVLLKGSKVVATLIPLSADQLEIIPQRKKIPNASKAPQSQSRRQS